MPMRPRSAETTLEIALTIPVNIYVSADQDVTTEGRDVDVAQWHRILQTVSPTAGNRPGSLAAPDQFRRYVRVNLVCKSRGQECGVRFAATFDEEAEKASLSELVEQFVERDAAVFARRKSQNLGAYHAPAGCSGNQGLLVGRDHTRRSRGAQVRVEHHA